MTPAETTMHSSVALARRILAHYVAGTTDQAPTPMHQPIEAYLDPDRFDREVDAVFKRLPLALALSTELAGPGDFVTQNVLGVPVLLARGRDGVVRAFVNACRHRGSPVCVAASGSTRRFTCPYHAWVYDERGDLVGMFGADTFGDVDRAELALTPLACAERVGFIWACLTANISFDIDEWLGDFAAELAALRLDEWHIYRRTELEGPGWKVAFDGYLEGYHQQALHPETVGKTTIANLMVADTFGPHQRIVFGRTTLGQLVDIPEADWVPGNHIRLIHSVFPNVSISGILGDHCLVSQLYPSAMVDRSRTIQTVLVKDQPTTPDAVAAADSFAAMVLQAVRDEDYDVGFKIQAGLAGGGNAAFVFGRNEPTLQHYHRSIERYAATYQ